MATSTTNTPNYFRVVFNNVTPKGLIRKGNELLIDALNEKEALDIATKRLEKEFKWHKIQGCYKA